MVTANVLIHEPISLAKRAARYKAPVQRALERGRLGRLGEGSGTLSSADGEILEVDFDVELRFVDSIPLVTKILEDHGAPKGSLVTYRRRLKHVEVRFGVTECVAIYMDGVSQPRELYRAHSSDELLAKLRAALGSDAEYRGSWKGPRETSLYFYGADAEHVFAKAEPVLREYPPSRTARVIIRHGNEDHQPREVQLAQS